MHGAGLAHVRELHARMVKCRRTVLLVQRQIALTPVSTHMPLCGPDTCCAAPCLCLPARPPALLPVLQVQAGGWCSCAAVFHTVLPCRRPAWAVHPGHPQHTRADEQGQLSRHGVRVEPRCGVTFGCSRGAQAVTQGTHAQPVWGRLVNRPQQKMSSSRFGGCPVVRGHRDVGPDTHTKARKKTPELKHICVLIVAAAAAAAVWSRPGQPPDQLAAAVQWGGGRHAQAVLVWQGARGELLCCGWTVGWREASSRCALQQDLEYTVCVGRPGGQAVRSTQHSTQLPAAAQLLLLPRVFCLCCCMQTDATFSSLSCCHTGVTCYLKSGGCVMR